MEAKMKRCVNCGKPLSVTAKSCNECNSTDPFGIKRQADKLQMYLVLAGIIAVLVIGGLWHAGIINPASWFSVR